MTITLEEAASQLPILLGRVVDGEEVTITRQGIPVVRMAPVLEPRRHTSAEAVDAILELRKGVRLNGLSIREMIDEGRK